MYGSYVEDYRRASKERLTTRCHGYIIGDGRDEGQDASLRIEMGNPNLMRVKIVGKVHFSGL